MTQAAQRPWNPWNDPACLAWFATLRGRFGLIPQIGLPDKQDHADVPLDALYVPLRVGAGRTKPGEKGEGAPLARAVRPGRRLVILGDPGSGKSTLVSWLCYAASQRPGRDDPEGARVRIALPVVLRHLSLDTTVRTWDALLERVGRQSWWKLAGDERLAEWCGNGRALLVVDGLDELANLDVRRAVIAAVLDAARRFPAMGIVVTSRILGYHEAPLEGEAERGGLDTLEPALRERLGDRLFETLYVQPFRTPEIADFARRWYALRVKDAEAARERADDFLAAIQRHSALQGLRRLTVFLGGQDLGVLGGFPLLEELVLFGPFGGFKEFLPKCPVLEVLTLYAFVEVELRALLAVRRLRRLEMGGGGVSKMDLSVLVAHPTLTEVAVDGVPPALPPGARWKFVGI